MGHSQDQDEGGGEGSVVLRAEELEQETRRLLEKGEKASSLLRPVFSPDSDQFQGAHTRTGSEVEPGFEAWFLSTGATKQKKAKGERKPCFSFLFFLVHIIVPETLFFNAHA